MRERLEYLAAWITLKLLSLLPSRMARAMGAGVASLLFQLRPDIRKTADFNLRLAFPEWPEPQRKRVIQGMVRNLGWMAAEFARLPSYTGENIAEAIVLDDFQNFIDAERRGKGVLLLTGHTGAWELSPFAHAVYHKPLHFLVRPVENLRVDALINRYRCCSGNQPIMKNESARAVLRVLHGGGVVGILADQNTMPEEAVFVDFFGISAATTTGVARLARHTGAAVVPAYSYWDASIGKYRLHYEPALELPTTDDEQGDILAHTTRFNQVIENYIRRFPDQWVWLHRRWKTRPPGEPPVYPDQNG
jgi:KDO2-lipid IV(A) lauroyltransferase